MDDEMIDDKAVSEDDGRNNDAVESIRGQGTRAHQQWTRLLKTLAAPDCETGALSRQKLWSEFICEGSDPEVRQDSYHVHRKGIYQMEEKSVSEAINRKQLSLKE